ncbi:hypothetical protein MGG_03249 [Pyricularia oryzae 70-15]|uniref:Uncharacterized protein n=3 Tax=Pyricularia oryzae TaxID=318829 RepID=G4N9V4_PYRO7|nr:uncharacterized protein MGG_03249 [Pyricularia oryzae 70-15]EHA50406.1 hypothetical protein MGG_03249 [Pyricularia oryzae 70-15]ELQ34523.1 hypothetical protein OOU_Y34scaffold00765g69 [Pyricularia oryzae Y34]KAI7931539.1 hypothetical protein M9X92_000370 [Pyricularia oryzae]KAI7931631.1 hypothetical protein M0657_001129 [Pyricularia oryzae]
MASTEGMSVNTTSTAGSPESHQTRTETMDTTVQSSAASTATTQDMTGSSTSRYQPPSASAASSVFSAPTWWPQLGFRGARGGDTATTLASATGASSRAHVQGSVPPPVTAGPSRRPVDVGLPTSPPSPEQQHQQQANNVAEARAALEASMANILDRELVPRATALHRGERVIKKQQADVVRATGALRQANRQLEEVVEDVSWKLREVGDLQNWTELLEQRFLAVEETMRLVREGDSDEGSCSSCQCSECCSDCGESEWDGSADEGEEVPDANSHNQDRADALNVAVGLEGLPSMSRPVEQRRDNEDPLVSKTSFVDACYVSLPEEAWSPVDIDIACQVPLPEDFLLGEQDDCSDAWVHPQSTIPVEECPRAQ